LHPGHFAHFDAGGTDELTGPSPLTLLNSAEYVTSVEPELREYTMIIAVIVKQHQGKARA